MTTVSMALVLAFGADRAMAQRALGVDVSNYQGSDIDWSSVKGSGISFAWALATDGSGFTDGDFAGDMNNGKSAGVFMGAYHFAQPNSDTPSADADYFWSVAGAYIKADGQSLMPMLDMEVFSGYTGASSYSDWANQWCNDVVSEAAAANVKVKPVIYMSSCDTSYFNSDISSWIPDIANYNPVDDGETAQDGSPWDDSGCTPNEIWGSGVWSVWQYSSSGSVSGISGGVDVDVFNGTEPQLASTMLATCAQVPFLGEGFGGTNAQPSGVLFNPNTSTWTVRFSTDGSLHSFNFNESGATPLMNGDFDGDGCSDAVLFDAPTSEWYVRFSKDQSIHTFSFGEAGDIGMVVPPFVGDTQPDAVIFRPSNGNWYVRFSRDGSVHNFAFGQSGDIPMMNGDFDGDGDPDAVTFTPSTGTWQVRFSSDASIHTFTLGQNGDIPLLVPPFVGDTQPDAVTFTPSTGTWQVRFSRDGSIHTFAFGQNGDIPMMSGDFDGDGNPDAVLYRPSNNTWYVRFSSDASIHSFSF